MKFGELWTTLIEKNTTKIDLNDLNQSFGVTNDLHNQGALKLDPKNLVKTQCDINNRPKNEKASDVDETFWKDLLWYCDKYNWRLIYYDGKWKLEEPMAEFTSANAVLKWILTEFEESDMNSSQTKDDTD